MRKTLPLLLLITLLLCPRAYANPPATTVNVSGSCFDAPVELAQYESLIDGKPAWTATTAIAGVPDTFVALYWDSALGAWVLTFNGQPFFVYEEDTPSPPNNTTGVWSQVDGTTDLCPVSTAIAISGTGTQSPPAVIALSTPDITHVDCFGTSTGGIVITASGGTEPYTYTLNPGGTQNNTGTFTGLAAGDYTVSVEDAANTTTTSGTITVSQPAAALSLNAPGVTGVNCSGPNTGEIAITASGGTGGYTYTLSPGNVQNNTGTFTGLTAGDYTVAVADANNCTTSSGTINVPPAPGLSLSEPTVSDVKCNDESTGEISLSADGGTGPYTYTLNPGNVQNNTGQFTGLAAGDYTISVADANGCTATSGTIQVAQPPLLTIQSGGDKLVFLGVGSTCTTISASASGGSGGYYYIWSPGNLTGESVEVCPTETTIYTVTVTDLNYCTATAAVTVTVANVSCGNKNDKVLICHKGRELCVSPDALADHLGHGDVLGSCNGGSNSRTGVADIHDEAPFSLALKAYPNPATQLVKVEIQSQAAGLAQLDLLDMAGRPLLRQTEQLREGLNEVTINMGTQATGIYLLRCRDLLGRQAVLRISKH